MSLQPVGTGGPAAAGAAVGETIAVVVNGAGRDVPAGASLADLVLSLGLAGRPLAVERNGTVVPRSQLGACMLAAGDRIEIVTLVGGG